MRILPMRILPTVSAPNGFRLVEHTGRAVPLLSRNKDVSNQTLEERDDSNTTDAVLDPLRCLIDNREGPDFLLRGELYRGASILLADEFVGLSGLLPTEVGLPALGIRVVIAPGFGSEFFSEAVRQGILLIPLSVELIYVIAGWVQAHPQTELTVDLQSQLIRTGLHEVPFQTHPRLRDKLLRGLDELDEHLQYRKDAAEFRRSDQRRRPWLYNCDPTPSGSDESG